MKLHDTLRRYAAVAVLAVVIAVTLAAGLVPASAHTTQTYAKRHLNWVQRHPTLTGVGAGIATHHALKVMAARDKARGKKLNWAERHPTLSALGAGVVVHHEIKKHTPR